MASKVKPIPEGYHTATPYLILKDAAKAIEFYKRAFGAAELMRFPEQKVSIACLCNLATTNPTGLAQQVADIYLAEAIKAAQAQVTNATSGNLPGAVVIAPEKLQAKAGLYRSPATGDLRRITFRDGDGADRAGLEITIRDISPGDSHVVGLPQPAASRSHVVGFRIAHHAGSGN